MCRNLLFLCPVFWAFSGAVSGAEPIGVVKTLVGSASIVRAGQIMPCRMELHIFVNDVIQTAVDGRVGILFSDGARMALDPGSELKISRFQFVPSRKDFGMVRGMVAYISGKIGHFSPESVRMETPVAVIGLRGTHFVVSLDGN
jgi:hypothetical protein